METISIGEQIAKLRRAAGLTQEELGRAVGVSTQAVSRWECGGTPDVALLPAIADKLGVTIDALFGRGDSAPRNMEDTFAGWFRALPEDARLEQLSRLLWAFHFSYTPVEQSAVHRPASCEMNDPALGEEAVLLRTVLETEQGFLLQVSADDLSFAAVFPEPAAGYARYLLPDEEYERFFAVLARPGAVRLLRFLCSDQAGHATGSYYTAPLVAKRLGMALEQAESLMDVLAEAGLLGRIEVAAEDRVLHAYVSKLDCGIVAFLYLARWVAQNKTRVTFSCWDPREAPLFRTPQAPEAPKEEPHHETH